MDYAHCLLLFSGSRETFSFFGKAKRGCEVRHKIPTRAQVYATRRQSALLDAPRSASGTGLTHQIWSISASWPHSYSISFSFSSLSAETSGFGVRSSFVSLRGFEGKLPRHHVSQILSDSSRLLSKGLPAVSKSFKSRVYIGANR